LTTHQRVWWEEHDPAESHNPKLVEQLRKIEHEVRQKFLVEKTLREQLDEAVAREDYEQAAQLRDQIQAQARAQR
jgi:protein-arginine kinase activator protein McsA